MASRQKARNERSAGVVVYCDHAGGRSYLLLDYGKHWDFPKGHVEKGEDDRAAALRELREETGIVGRELIEGFGHELTYFFRDRRSRGLIRKAVVFFVARVQDQAVTLSDEHVGYVFLPFEEAVRKATFAGAKEVLRLAEAFLAKRGQG